MSVALVFIKNDISAKTFGNTQKITHEEPGNLKIEKGNQDIFLKTCYFSTALANQKALGAWKTFDVRLPVSIRYKWHIIVDFCLKGLFTGSATDNSFLKCDRPDSYFGAGFRKDAPLVPLGGYALPNLKGVDYFNGKDAKRTILSVKIGMTVFVQVSLSFRFHAIATKMEPDPRLGNHTTACYLKG